ncbi:MAG: helix-turn-helix transcriptional regulator [Anaerolineae bacterium]|nr:helix-turn-helix transcriptional regulator [Anaerolineae bacterium]
MSPRSKYYPLFEYLQQQPDTGLLELNFVEIEEILGKPLPPSARTSRAWWANTQTAQGRSWQEAKWLVDNVDFDDQYVLFRPARITYRVTPVRRSQGWSGAQVKALREFAGWTQQELADRLSVRQQTVSDWELDIHTCHRSMGKLMQMIAKEMGFSYEANSTEDED